MSQLALKLRFGCCPWRQQHDPDDYIIATGEAHSLQEFVATVFGAVGLDWRKHVDSDPSLFRPADIGRSQGNPEKAARKRGWKPGFLMRDVVKGLVDWENRGREGVCSTEQGAQVIGGTTGAIEIIL
ncbi:MAG: GDP-mannose 4,6-dehydratase [Porticoccaceae bacterium]